MDTILSIIVSQFHSGLTVAGLAYVAFAGVWAIGAWAALRD